MLLDLLSQIEPDDSWRGSYPDWFPRPAAVVHASESTPFVGISDQTTADHNDSGVVYDRQLQYQSYASPFSAVFITTPAQPYLQSEMPVYPRLLPTAIYPTGSFGSEPTVNPFWTPVYPDRVWGLSSPATLPTVAFTPTHEATEGNALDWTPRFPDRFPAATRPEGQSALWPFPLPATVTVFGSAEVPIWRPIRIFGDAFTIGVETEANPFAWEPQYPDRLWSRQASRPSDTAFTPAHNPAEGNALDWTPTSPAWNARPGPWQHRAQMSVFYPFPFAPFNPAVARFDAVYPDRIARITLLTATIPYFVPGPFEPIPNPPVTNLPKDLHLGTEESLGVTPDPTIGGWQSW